MNIYLRKILNHDITHQISLTREVLNGFFGAFKDGETVIMRGKKFGERGTVKFLLATDPRFGGDIGNIIRSEGGMEENDIIVFVKSTDSYIIEIIKSADSRHQTFISMMEEERHLILHVDDVDNSESEGESKTSQFAHNRIVFGAPGTGKSFQLEKDRKLFNCEYKRVTFHANYSYSQFVGTYKPTLKEGSNEKIIYRFVPGPFLEIWIDAYKSKQRGENKNYILIIEEINRANAASVFGDVFQLLDRKKGESEFEISTSEEVERYLSLMFEGENWFVNLDPHEKQKHTYKIKLPNNLYIWATMNSADQGVVPMDAAFKRRWKFEYIGIDSNSENNNIIINLKPFGEINWNEIRKSINNELANSDLKVNEDKLIGPFFLSKEELESEDINEIFKSKLLMYLYEDVLRHRRGSFFKPSLNTFSNILEAYDRGENIFSFAINDRNGNNLNIVDNLNEISTDILT